MSNMPPYRTQHGKLGHTAAVQILVRKGWTEEEASDFIGLIITSSVLENQQITQDRGVKVIDTLRKARPNAGTPN